MACTGNNATPPGPAEAPGAERIDPLEAAAQAAERGVDARLRRWVPGLDAPFVQAGLAGYSDAAMRIMARRHGCPMCVTEALLDRALLGGGRGFDKADLELIRDNVPGGEEDRPLVGQLIGSDPDEMAVAALKMIEQGARADREYRRLAYGENGGPRATEIGIRSDEAPGRLGAPGAGRASWVNPAVPATSPEGEPLGFASIEVNLACPVKKIQAKARGGHWLAEPEGAIAILRAVRAAVPAGTACSVKLRRAFDDTPEQARNFEVIFEAAYELGYAWATVHARTVAQKYMGPSRWACLRDLVRRHPDRPVLGSGDVCEAGDIFRMLAYTGVSAVSVARGCIGNPWLFRQARAMLAGRAPEPPTVAEQGSVLREHYRLASALVGEGSASRTMRKFGIRFAAHHPRGEQVRQRMIGAASAPQWWSVLDEFYGEEPAGAGAAAGSVGRVAAGG